MPRHKKRRPAQTKTATQPVVDRPASRDRVGLFLILLTTFLIYMPAMKGGKIWDDELNLTRPEFQSLHGLYRIWFDPAATAKEVQYYPLVHTAFWLEHRLWGDSFLGYHLVNVLWHSVSVLLVYSIVKRLRIPGALLAAAIFAVHPVMVESVAWMTEQKNTLSTVFYLSAMLMYLEFDESRRLVRYLIALGLFACALLTKTATVTWPVGILIILWWQRGKLSWQRDVLPLFPFFAFSLAAGVVTTWVEWKLVGAEGSDFELTFLQRCLLAGRDIWFYLGKLAWPTNLSFTYSRWTIDPAQWWQWTFSILALAATYALWAIRNRWRGPLAGWLFFCATLAPVLGFLNVFMFRFTFVADHLQYLASLGIIVPVSAGVAIGLTNASLATRRAGLILCILVLCTLAIASSKQSRMYADVVTLYQTTIERNPDCWMAHNNLGQMRSSRGDSQAAVKHFRAAIRIRPEYAEAHNNLGLELMNADQLPAAIDEFKAALASMPDYSAALCNLGIALIKVDRVPEAIESLQAALKLKPDSVPILNNLALALIRTGRLSEALMHLEYAVRVQPDLDFVQNLYGTALQQNGQSEPAIKHFQAAIRLQPGNLRAHANLARAFSAVQQPEAAITAAKNGITAARAVGDEAMAQQLEGWLSEYQAELHRTGDVINRPSTPPAEVQRPPTPRSDH